MPKIKRIGALVASLLLVMLFLGACGDSNTVSPVATSPIALTTAATSITTKPVTTNTKSAVAWTQDGVCYSLFVRSFFDSNGDGKGDLHGVIAKLDYLNDGKPDSTKSLSVNCIWLLPVTESPTYHGYDTTDYYKINPDYGTNEDFKKLVQEAHKRGINVLVDMVFNHTSIKHPWFQQAAADPKSPYRNWYIFSDTDPGYPGPMGKAWHKNPLGEGYYYGVFDSTLPDLNLTNPDVTKELYKVTEFWIKEMGVDGFRMDAVKHFIEDGQKQVDTPQTHQWLRDYRKYYLSLKPDFYTIGEVSTGSSLLGYYPDQLENYFEFSLALSFVNSAKRGQASFVNLIQDANKNWLNQRYGTFLTNHDQPRIMDALGNDMAMMKLAATAYLTSTGLPFIYYGEEIGMLGVKPDEQIRTPMQWSGDSKGGFSAATPWEPLNPDVAKVNVQAQDSDSASLLNLYRKLIQIRRATPAVSHGDYTPLNSNHYKVATYLRHSESSDVLVVLNMSNEAITDLTLNIDKSSLAFGQYSPTLLMSLDGTSPALAPLTVQADGAVSGYAPLINIPPTSGYIIKLKIN